MAVFGCVSPVLDNYLIIIIVICRLSSSPAIPICFVPSEVQFDTGSYIVDASVIPIERYSSSGISSNIMKAWISDTNCAFISAKSSTVT